MFEIFLTEEAKKKLGEMDRDKGLAKRVRAVVKALEFLAHNPRHPSLQTHEFTSLKGPNGEKVFQAYAEQSTPAAHRIFWYYGPKSGQITIVTVLAHP